MLGCPRAFRCVGRLVISLFSKVVRRRAGVAVLSAAMVAVGLASGAQAWVGPGEGSSANLVVGDLSALSTGDVVLQGELVDMGSR